MQPVDSPQDNDRVITCQGDAILQSAIMGRDGNRSMALNLLIMAHTMCWVIDLYLLEKSNSDSLILL